MEENRQVLDNEFIRRKLLNDKKHITIKDMMAYIAAYCPENKDWFKKLILEKDDVGNSKHKTLELKKMFYEKCVPAQEKKLKKSAREKLIDEMGW